MHTFAPVKRTTTYGTLTEWLGSGLQNRVQQFESAGYLLKIEEDILQDIFLDFVLCLLDFWLRHLSVAWRTVVG